MQVSVVTLLWRNERFVPAFVRSLTDAVRTAGLPIELVAVENGPEGARAAALLAAQVAQEPQVGLCAHRLEANRGFAGGMNVGAALATGEVLVIANLDLEFDAEFFVALDAHASSLSQCAFVAPSVRAPVPHRVRRATTGADGRPIAVTGETGALRRDWLHRPAAAHLATAHASVPAGNGSCIVFGRDVLAARCAAVGGLFDEEYHSYYEDVDLFWWAQRASIPVWYAPDVRVTHHQGGSFDGQYRFADRTADVRASVMANYRITVWKNVTGISGVMGWLAGEAGYLAKCIVVARAAGVASYAASWRLTRSRVTSIRARRGSLRPAHRR